MGESRSSVCGTCNGRNEESALKNMSGAHYFSGRLEAFLIETDRIATSRSAPWFIFLFNHGSIKRQAFDTAPFVGSCRSYANSLPDADVGITWPGPRGTSNVEPTRTDAQVA